MDISSDYIELIGSAQGGDREALNRLAHLTRERLYAYVYRSTLCPELSQDIVQESLLEMVKILGKLEKADRFWPWLCGIAHNKIRNHWRRERPHRAAALSRVSEPGAGATSLKEAHEGLAHVMGKELREVIFSAMGGIKPRYRDILAMRCYENMDYGAIAGVMGCSELYARVLFQRAKRALGRQLSKRGLGRGALLGSLILFGKLTASSEAAAANLPITATTIKVGAAASVAAAFTSKAAVVALATVGVIAAGSVAELGPDGKSGLGPQTSEAHALTATGEAEPVKVQCAAESWYYYPPRGEGAVMRRSRSAMRSTEAYCQWLQNDQANFYQQGNRIYINNHRQWDADLTVPRLPTDNWELREFLTSLDGNGFDMERVVDYGVGLLVVVTPKANGASSQVTYRYDVSYEEYFRYSWPKQAEIVDHRDAMHQRGWTYFRVKGQIDGIPVSGKGRLPFVYAARETHWPWLTLRRGENSFVDAGSGWLFAGLSRPWMGLHTIDSVRRDAAEAGVRSEAELLDDGKAEVLLTCEEGTLTYTIDMDRDVVEQIHISASSGNEGMLRFSYLQTVDSGSSEFREPPGASYGYSPEGMGIKWLFALAHSR